MTIFVFMLSNCIGLSGAILFTSTILLQVIGLELIIASTSASSILNKQSLRLLPCCFSRAARMLLADIICRCHTPLILLAVGRLFLQINHSPPSSIRKSLIFVVSISLNATTKLLLLLPQIILIFSLLLMSLLST